MIVSALRRFFPEDPARRHAHEAYVSVVAQARRPSFYSQWQVEDTVDGRFDMIVLHLSLVIERCERDSGEEMQHFIRLLSEAFFSDMDRSLREMGSTDTGTGIRVKKMAQAFYGRLKAYHTQGEALTQALHRNAYREKPVAPDILAAFAAYIERNRAQLAAQPLSELTRGHIRFSS